MHRYSAANVIAAARRAPPWYQRRLLQSALVAFHVFLSSLVLGLLPLPAQAQQNEASQAQGIDLVSLDDLSSIPLGRQLTVLEEHGAPLSVPEVLAALSAGQGYPGRSGAIGFGIGHRPVWLVLDVRNPASTPVAAKLLLGQSWLDHVSVNVVAKDGAITSWSTGDAVAGMPNLEDALGFVFGHNFEPGQSRVAIRIATADPMAITLRLVTPDEFTRLATREHYGYGFVTGFIVSLAFYNLMLFIGLRRVVHLQYSLYLLAFVGLNLSYSGRGAAWLWSDWPDLQRYVILVFMVLQSCAGLHFARSFLELDQHSPRIARGVRSAIIAGLAAIGLTAVFGLHEAAAWVAFIYLAGFIVAMVSIGAVALAENRKGARYFFVAALCSMFCIAITELAVWGMIPFNEFTYHAMEFGMMLDATLLALALTQFVRTQVDERVRAEREARIDLLTQLANRRGFMEQAGSAFQLALRHQRPLSAIMVDVDHFKQINDQHGHAVGDKVLIEVAQFLAWAARRADVVARWGGEEFVLLLPETGHEEAHALAERLRVTIQELSIAGAGARLRVTASFGVAQQHDTQTLEQLVAAADVALYEAKRGGRNRVEVACAQSGHGADPLPVMPA